MERMVKLHVAYSGMRWVKFDDILGVKIGHKMVEVKIGDEMVMLDEHQHDEHWVDCLMQTVSRPKKEEVK